MRRVLGFCFVLLLYPLTWDGYLVAYTVLRWRRLAFPGLFQRLHHCAATLIVVAICSLAFRSW